ncbi:hypothetical protein M2272_005763 [Mycobacterium frederiksbergense]|uniref:Uncharacterized protein n=1 Tax=Mycolicibacterium frederiksbergense TaxID=117567 RepID=A0ABT6L931_9MYCO|nr:hypothetical protein [Mycolicibacterium frederiksbergense]
MTGSAVQGYDIIGDVHGYATQPLARVGGGDACRAGR